MTVEAAFQSAVAGAWSGELSIPGDLHGFPGTAHGGAVAAVVHRLTLPRFPARIRLSLRRPVPTGTPLRLVSGSAGAEARVGIWQDDRHLADGRVSRAPAGPASSPPARAEATLGVPEGHTPRTRTCLGCGTDNPLGLGLQLQVNPRFIWQRYEPRESYRIRDGLAHPALATVILDELGWWLGALALGECGVTTEMLVTLWRPIPFAPLLVLGDRAATRPDDTRGRYRRAAAGLFTDTGAPVATGDVRFGGSRAYTRRLLEPFLGATSLADLSRVFPGVTTLAEGGRGLAERSEP